MTMKAYHPIGTISHATLRTEDLLGSFADALENAMATVNWQGNSGKPECYITYGSLVDQSRTALAVLESVSATKHERFQAETDGWELVNVELPDALNSFAPPYCCFGTHEGDGSDFGFWPMYDDETLAEARESGYRVDVSDHGNVALYDAKDQEVWSIV